MDLIHGTSLLSTPGDFGPVVLPMDLQKSPLPYPSKNDAKKIAS